MQTLQDRCIQVILENRLPYLGMPLCVVQQIRIAEVKQECGKIVSQSKFVIILTKFVLIRKMIINYLQKSVTITLIKLYLIKVKKRSSVKHS